MENTHHYKIKISKYLQFILTLIKLHMFVQLI